MYVEELIGPDTVDTMPQETVDAFQDHGERRADDREGRRRGAARLRAAREAGVDYDDVSDTLEREGVQKFIDSFTELLEGIESKREQLAPA